jgi:hypothetical protein
MPPTATPDAVKNARRSIVFEARDESKEPEREPFATPLVFFLNITISSVIFILDQASQPSNQERLATLADDPCLKIEPIPDIYVCVQYHEDRGLSIQNVDRLLRLSALLPLQLLQELQLRPVARSDDGCFHAAGYP